MKFLEIDRIVSGFIQLVEKIEEKLGQLLRGLADEIRYPDMDAFLDFALATVE